MYEDIKKVKTDGFVCNEQKRPRIKRERRERQERHRSKPMGSSLLIRTAVCAMLLGVVMLIVYLDMPVTNKMKSGIVSALTFEIDVDKSLGKLKFVQSNESEIKDVMSSSSGVAMTLPVKNAVTVSNYNESGTSMVFEATELTDVISPCAGIVENIESNKQFEITIDHGNDTKSVLTFNGAMAVIKEGSVLKKGDYVGLMDKGSSLTFSVINKGQNVDPAGYIQN